MSPIGNLSTLFRIKLAGTVVATASYLDPASLSLGTSKKRNNAIAALLSGLLPASLLALHAPPGWPRFFVALAIGLFWANGFEYAYHRWLLHWPRSTLGKGHLMHHSTIGAPEEPAHVTLGSHPLAVIALFVINGVPLVLFDLLAHTRLSPGIFLGWSIYFIVLEEVHWHIHLATPSPGVWDIARRYRLAHHDIPNSRYNVFVPVFDFLLGSAGLRPARTHTARS